MHVQYGAAYIGSFGPWRVDPELERCWNGCKTPADSVGASARFVLLYSIFLA